MPRLNPAATLDTRGLRELSDAELRRCEERRFHEAIDAITGSIYSDVAAISVARHTRVVRQILIRERRRQAHLLEDGTWDE